MSWNFLDSLARVTRKIVGSGATRLQPPDLTADAPAWRRRLSAAGSNPASLDFAALRLEYASSPDYDPYDLNEEAHAAVQRAIERGAERAANAALKTLFARAFMDIRTHLAAMAVFDRFARAQEREYHAWFGHGLFKAIEASGDGRGFDSAYVVLSVGEEYVLLQGRGLEKHSQALREHGGHQFDVMTVSDGPNGDRYDVYFNIDLPKGWLDRRSARASGN